MKTRHHGIPAHLQTYGNPWIEVEISELVSESIRQDFGLIFKHQASQVADRGVSGALDPVSDHDSVARRGRDFQAREIVYWGGR